MAYIGEPETSDCAALNTVLKERKDHNQSIQHTYFNAVTSTVYENNKNTRFVYL